MQFLKNINGEMVIFYFFDCIGYCISRAFAIDFTSQLIMFEFEIVLECEFCLGYSCLQRKNFQHLNCTEKFGDRNFSEILFTNLIFKPARPPVKSRHVCVKNYRFLLIPGRPGVIWGVLVLPGMLSGHSSS